MTPEEIATVEAMRHEPPPSIEVDPAWALVIVLCLVAMMVLKWDVQG